MQEIRDVAVLGGEVRVPRLGGQPVILNIPAGTQGGRTFRLQGMGMPKLRKPEERGDLYAKARIVVPTQLGQREKELFTELAQRRATAPPK